MNVTLVVRDSTTEVVTLDGDWEVKQLKEDLNDPTILFLLFTVDDRKVMINKSSIIKIWWKEEETT